MLTQSRRLALPFGFSIAPSCHSQRPQQRAAWLLVFWLAPFSPRLCRALCVCVVCVNRSGIWRYGHDMDLYLFQTHLFLSVTVQQNCALGREYMYFYGSVAAGANGSRWIQWLVV